jgi:hypothetical protein
MNGPVKCAKGHWYQPDPSGTIALCPRCQAESKLQHRKPISEDDVLAILGESDGGAPKSSAEQTEALQTHHKLALKRHKKVCRTCHSETSFAFEYCPRCGGPLDIAVIDVP